MNGRITGRDYRITEMKNTERGRERGRERSSMCLLIPHMATMPGAREIQCQKLPPGLGIGTETQILKTFSVAFPGQQQKV